MSFSYRVLLLLSCFFLSASIALATNAKEPHRTTGRAENGRAKRRPIMLDETGGYTIGGKVITDPKRPNETLSCDHGYVEYFYPTHPRSTTFLLWHSSSTQVFQNSWSGGSGLKDQLLRRSFPVLLWDGPRVGRANYACIPITTTPTYRDNGNLAAWNLGPAYPTFWNNTRFPVENRMEVWKAATRARYEEFDTNENVLLHGSTMATALDTGRLGAGGSEDGNGEIVFVTNSAAGLRAQLAVAKAGKGYAKGIFAFESKGYIFPPSFNTTASNFSSIPGFGPVTVTEAEFSKLAKLDVVKFIWGDHRAKNDMFVRMSVACAREINLRGGRAEVVMLGEWDVGDGRGKGGWSHIAFMDVGNEGLVERMVGWLDEGGLGGRWGLETVEWSEGGVGR